MTIPRFFHDAIFAAGTRVELPKNIAHYARRVLRLNDGAAVYLFNGKGGQYRARLSYDDSKTWAEIDEFEDKEAELAGRITLVQGLATGDKMDWIVEKASELGVHTLVPVAAEHSVLQLRGERATKRLEHWKRVAQAASEQCGRNRVMAIATISNLEEFLKNHPQTATQTSFLCHPDYGIPLSNAINTFLESCGGSHADVTLNLLIGPEGGWSRAEVALAAEHKVQAVLFGPRILRTETAGLALVAAATALLGWNDVS